MSGPVAVRAVTPSVAPPTLLLAAFAALAATPAAAQVAEPPVDCMADALAPGEIALCAEQGWQASQGDLDLAYGLALTAAEVLDEGRFVAGEQSGARAAELIEAGQADWTAHRDSHCAAEALLAPPGVERRALGLLCLERLNRLRIEQLAAFREAG